MTYPAERLEHYPRHPTVDDDGRHEIRCSCGQAFTGDTLQEAANRWGDHDDEATR